MVCIFCHFHCSSDEGKREAGPGSREARPEAGLADRGDGTVWSRLCPPTSFRSKVIKRSTEIISPLSVWVSETRLRANANFDPYGDSLLHCSYPANSCTFSGWLFSVFWCNSEAWLNAWESRSFLWIAAPRLCANCHEQKWAKVSKMSLWLKMYKLIYRLKINQLCQDRTIKTTEHSRNVKVSHNLPINSTGLKS